MLLEIRTPCRLHFGLLAYSRDDQRQFGGAGLTVRRPEVVIRARVNPLEQGFTATGRMGDKALAFAQRFSQQASRAWGVNLEPARIDVIRVPRPHTGMGSGTQLGMAVAQALAHLAGREQTSAEELASLVGRGERSAIGVHGFFHGGFIVEGGKTANMTLSPMVMRHAFPEAWRIVIIRPRALEGIAGEREVQAFAKMPSIPLSVTAEMCRLVLLGLAPGILQTDIDLFGESLYQLQQTVGQCFAAAQGGIYAHPLLDDIVRFIRASGIKGVGQSSWGPTLYAVLPDEASADRLANAVEARFNLHAVGEVFVTSADNEGSSIRRLETIGAL